MTPSLILNRLLGRKNGIAELITRAMEHTKGAMCVEALNGAILLGNALPETATSCAVLAEQETVGWVKGTSHDAQFISQLLNQCISQEINTKKLGAELLHQYKEINLIYAFSEKLSAVVGLERIAGLVLQEAGQIIRFSEGAVVYSDAISRETTVKAEVGSGFFSLVDWQNEANFFREIAQNGQSTIAELPGEPARFLLYASLRVRDRVLGAILLIGEVGQEFSAADLKLLTTLAFQTTAAMESALLHEKTTEQALKTQREELVFELAKKHPFFKKVLAVVQANLDNPDFSVERLAKAMNLSPSQLQRKTVSLADRTPVQLIRDLRLQKAKDLLRQSDLTVAEIAFQTGFNDPSYFTRLFTRETTMTPSTWKEKAGEAGS